MNLLPTTSESSFVSTAVELLSSTIESAITTDGRCVLGLSGGSTPGPIYTELGKQDLPWNKVWIFLVDERYTQGEEGNWALLQKTILQHAPIPQEQVITPDTSLPLEECIEEYDTKIRSLYTDHLPHLLTLGLGSDGHIASLFPPLTSDAFTEQHMVIHTTTNQFAVHDRISLALNPLLATQSHVFFLKGKEKKQVWDEMRESNESEERWPAKSLLSQQSTSVVSCWDN